MPFKHIALNALEPGSGEGELNAFLTAHRIINVNGKLVEREDGCWWVYQVQYADGTVPAGAKGTGVRIDYRETLPPEEFALFAKLRDMRKAISDKEGCPAFAVFTNEQLAAMVQGKCKTEAELRKIDGIGESRCTKYGAAALAVLNLPVATTAAQPLGK
jgi:superfamily II DNA helicase RecQ